MHRKLLYVFIFLSGSSFSQNDNHFYSEGFGVLWQNPATYGRSNKLEFNAVAKQFLNSGEDQYATMHNFAYRFHPRGNDSISFGTGYFHRWDQRTNGHTNLIGIPMNMQMHFQKMTVTAGITLGTNYSRGVYPSNDPDLPLFVENSGLSLYFGAGASISIDRCFLAVSVSHLTKERPHPGFEIDRTFAFQTGYKIPLRNFGLYPQLNVFFEGSSLGSIAGLLYFQFPGNWIDIGLGLDPVRFVSSGVRIHSEHLALAYNLQFHEVAVYPFADGEPFSHELRLSLMVPRFKEKLKAQL